MRRFDWRWRRYLTYGWLVGIIASLAVAPAFGAGPTAGADADPAEPAEAMAAETDSVAPAPASPTETSIEAAAALTWQLLSHEYCPDRFGTSCPNGATSADPCPVAEPEGKPCATAGDRCWYVLSTWWADEYWCV